MQIISKIVTLVLIMLVAPIIAASEAPVKSTTAQEDMVTIPAGKFTMGLSASEASILGEGYLKHEIFSKYLSIDGDSNVNKFLDEELSDEQPQKSIYLDAFAIDRNEVTVDEFCLFLNQQDPSSDVSRQVTLKDDFSGQGIIIKSAEGYKPQPGLASHPVTFVSWYGANNYCTSVGKRLPTESEWEKAARGSDGRLFPWGNAIPTKEMANFAAYTETEESLINVSTRAVGSFESDQSPYGVSDMAGNVAEWTSDWYDKIGDRSATEQNLQEPLTGSMKTIRGGKWSSIVNTELRVTVRGGAPPEMQASDVGFRCAKDVDKVVP